MHGLLFVELLSKFLEPLPQYVDVVEQGLREGKRVFGILSGNGLAGEVGAPVTGESEGACPICQHPIDQSPILERVEGPCEVFLTHA